MGTAWSPSPACVVPTPSQLAALGTVLCLHRPGAAREFDGWSSARRAQAPAGLDFGGRHESLRFFDPTMPALLTFPHYEVPPT
ncbi:MAG: hypothetical protein ACTIJY_00675 [Luteimonas sp.]